MITLRQIRTKHFCTMEPFSGKAQSWLPSALSGRRSTRLANYDYTRAGAYFVTICTWRRECLFGKVVDGTMRLSVSGQVVEEEWLRTGSLRSGVDLDSFVVMPNHLHAVLHLNGQTSSRRDFTSPRVYASRAPGSLGSVIAGFKQAVTLRLKRSEGVISQRLWQRNYYERVIRNEADLYEVRRYIRMNPQRWREAVRAKFQW